MAKRSQIWRINGKIADFKNFVKTFGLDAVSYESLTTHEKRVYNGLSQYSERLLIGTKFASESKVLRNPIIKEMADANNMPLKEFIKTHKRVLLDYLENDNIEISKNSHNAVAFVKAHRGKVFDGETETSKEALLFKFSNIETAESSGGKKAIIIYNFEVQTLGTNLKFVGYENPYKTGHFNRWKSGRGKQTINKKGTTTKNIGDKFRALKKRKK